KQEGLNSAQPVAMIYDPVAQLPNYWMSLVVRTRGEPENLAPAVIRSVHEVDAAEPVVDVMTMDDILAVSLLQRRFNMLLLVVFAGLALVLGAVGIYSVLAYAVKQRSREIGIRMALGAPSGNVLRLIVMEGMKPTLIGLAIGLAGALALGRILANLVYGVRATDVVTFAAVTVLLLAVGLLACLVPAYRATKLQPVKTLREE
ncbi:MAG: FtsX-like permease family protein, partial [Acidobacteriaceae bacterium]